MLVPIIMGSESDKEFAGKITSKLDEWGIPYKLHVASAHKVPLQCYDIIKEQEKSNPVFITIAGLSNALSGFSDAQTHCPVIACPPLGDSFGGGDVYSSLRMPSGVAPMVILNPENAALATAKILAVSNGKIREKVKEFQEAQRQKLIADNEPLVGVP